MMLYRSYLLQCFRIRVGFTVLSLLTKKEHLTAGEHPWDHCWSTIEAQNVVNMEGNDLSCKVFCVCRQVVASARLPVPLNDLRFSLFLIGCCVGVLTRMPSVPAAPLKWHLIPPFCWGLAETPLSRSALETTPRMLSKWVTVECSNARSQRTIQ